MEFFQRHKTLAVILAILTVGILALFTFFGGEEEEQLPLEENVVAKQVTLTITNLRAKALMQGIADDKQKIKEREAIVDELQQNILREREQVASLRTQLKGLHADLLLKERELRQSVIDKISE